MPCPQYHPHPPDRYWLICCLHCYSDYLRCRNILCFQDTGIQYPLCNPDTLLTVHIQCSVCDSYFIPRSCHDSLNIIMGILIAIGQKCHNISCLGGRQDIGKTVNVDLLSVLQCRFHGHTHHSCRPAEEDHYNSGEKHRQRNAEDPAEYLPQKCLTDLFLFFVKT